MTIFLGVFIIMDFVFRKLNQAAAPGIPSWALLAVFFFPYLLKITNPLKRFVNLAPGSGWSKIIFKGMSGRQTYVVETLLLWFAGYSILLSFSPLLTVLNVITNVIGGESINSMVGIFTILAAVSLVWLLNIFSAPITVDSVMDFQDWLYGKVDRFGRSPFFTADQVVRTLNGDKPLSKIRVSKFKVKQIKTSSDESVKAVEDMLDKASAALKFFSDARLKNNLTRVGTLTEGIDIYEWEWSDEALRLGVDPQRTRGVIAQEVLEVDPEAVSTRNGYYIVDAKYAK